MSFPNGYARGVLEGGTLRYSRVRHAYLSTESEIMRMRLPTAALRCSSRASRAMIDPGKCHIVDGRAAAPIGPACPHRMATAQRGRNIVNAHRRSETWNAAQRSANTHTRARAVPSAAETTHATAPPPRDRGTGPAVAQASVRALL